MREWQTIGEQIRCAEDGTARLTCCASICLSDSIPFLIFARRCRSVSICALRGRLRCPSSVVPSWLLSLSELISAASGLPTFD